MRSLPPTNSACSTSKRCASLPCSVSATGICRSYFMPPQPKPNSNADGAQRPSPESSGSCLHTASFTNCPTPIDIGSARTAASFSTPSSLRIAPPSASSWPLPPEKNVPKRKRNGGAVILLPDVGAYGAGIQRRNDEGAAIADIIRLRRLRGVHHDQNLLAGRRLEGHIRERVQVVGADADGAGTNELGRVGDGIVRHVAADVAAVDGDGALARTASAIVRVRLVPGIGRQIPEQDIAAPVPGGADDQPPHGCSDVCRRPGLDGTGNHLLGEIQVFPGVGIVNLGHRFDTAAIQVKTGAIDILGRLGVVQNGSRVLRNVAVVIVQDDFGIDSGLLERGP